MLLFDYYYIPMGKSKRIIKPEVRHKIRAVLQSGCNLLLNGDPTLCRLAILSQLAEISGDKWVYYPRRYSLECQISSSKTLNIGLLIYKNNYEFTPSKHDVYDKVALEKIILEFCSYKTLSKNNKDNIAYNQGRKNIIIYDVGKLSSGGQHCLKRLMDIKKSMRFILVNSGNIVNTIQSRCVSLTIPQVDNKDANSFFYNLFKRQLKSVTDDNKKLLARIIISLVQYSSRNNFVNIKETFHYMEIYFNILTKSKIRQFKNVN